MKVNFVGRRDLDFNAQDGSHIEGLRLYVTYESENHQDEGLVVERMFCNINKPDYEALKKCELPALLEVEFSRYGKPCGFKVVKK